AQSGLALLLEAPGGGAAMTVSDCDFFDNQKGFIVCASDAVCDVLDCVLTGRGPTTSLAQNGIQFSFGGGGTVSNCILDGFWWAGPSAYVSTGILAYDSGPGLSIDGCVMTDCQVGLYDFGQTGSLTTALTNNTVSQVSPYTTGVYPPAGCIFTDGDPGNAYVISGNSFFDHGDVAVALYTEGGAITGNLFNSNGANFSNINVQDEGGGPAAGAGNFWDSNCYSDYATNAGYPGSYTIYGALGSVDANPNVACPGFGAGVNVAVGTAPCDVILVDLAGDPEEDIATADSGSDTVTVLTNDGDGGFGTSTTVPLSPGDAPSALAAGDLVAGGGTDLAVAAQGADAVVIVSNAPAGTFSTSATLSTLPATEPVGVAVGDLDGAAPDDVVAAMQGDLLIAGTGSVAVSLNGGAFAALTPPVGGFLRPQSVALCDLDGDGDLDVVATMMGTAFAPTVTDNVLLYENTGGTFGAPIALSVAQNPRGLCCLDIDDDGDVDLAVTAESFPTILPGSIELLINDTLAPGTWSPGDFSAGGSYASGTSPIDLACGDLTDDSIPGFCARLDIVAANFGSENVSRFNGWVPETGMFSANEAVNANLVPVAVAVAELDGDKTPDVVVVNKASNDVTVMIDVTPALAKSFGDGCPGTTGVPKIEAVGLPTFSNPAFGVKVSNARVFAPTLLGLSLTQFTTDLGGGCSLYLLPPLVLIATVTDGNGETTVNLSIPDSSSSFAGCDAFFQYFIFDPNGPFQNQFAFSDALRIKVGN
ncbi:MAG: FG-GAP-like repeat-containing protein, partial [Planctomycetota bacterium JB042]